MIYISTETSFLLSVASTMYVDILYTYFPGNLIKAYLCDIWLVKKWNVCRDVMINWSYIYWISTICEEHIHEMKANRTVKWVERNTDTEEEQELRRDLKIQYIVWLWLMCYVLRICRIYTVPLPSKFRVYILRGLEAWATVDKYENW